MIKLTNLLKESKKMNEFISNKKDVKDSIGSEVTISMGGKSKKVVISDVDGDTVYLMTKDGKSGKVPVSKFISMVEGKVNESDLDYVSYSDGKIFIDNDKQIAVFENDRKMYNVKNSKSP